MGLTEQQPKKPWKKFQHTEIFRILLSNTTYLLIFHSGRHITVPMRPQVRFRTDTRRSHVVVMVVVVVGGVMAVCGLQTHLCGFPHQHFQVDADSSAQRL